MKAFYTIILICNAIHPMMRPCRPQTHSSRRNYSSQRTIQIKVTNPKLIASLEAARTKVNPTPPPLSAGQISKGPAIVCRKTNFYHPEVHSPQPKARGIPPQFSSNSNDIPTDLPSRPQILANAAVDVAEGYATYKTYQTIDNLLSEGSRSTHSRFEIPRHNHDISEEPDED